MILKTKAKQLIGITAAIISSRSWLTRTNCVLMSSPNSEDSSMNSCKLRAWILSMYGSDISKKIKRMDQEEE